MPTTTERASSDLRARARRSGSAVATTLLNRPLRSFGAGGAAMVLTATAAFGGLEPKESTSLAKVTPGTAIVAAPFELTIMKALWVDELPGAYLTVEGDRWLAITASITSTDDESVYDPLVDVLSLVAVDGLVKEPETGTSRVTSDQRLVIADGSTLSPVQPGLTYDVVFLYEQSGDVPPPTEVTVQVVRHTKRPGNLDRTVGWWDPAVVAEGTLPMRQAVDSGNSGDDEPDA